MKQKFLNGKFITQHKGGFTPFESEINRFVKDGIIELQLL